MKTAVKNNQLLRSDSGIGIDEYENSINRSFEKWESIKDENKKLSEENNRLRQTINQLLKDQSKEIHSSKTTRIPVKVIRDFFIPKIRPDIIKEKLGLSSSVFTVKKTEEYGLFRFPELVIRVPRTKKNKGKYETTVLYSLIGMIVLQKHINEELESQYKKAPQVSEKEQKEIDAIITPTRRKTWEKYKGKIKKDFKVVKAKVI